MNLEKRMKIQGSIFIIIGFIFLCLPQIFMLPVLGFGLFMMGLISFYIPKINEETKRTEGQKVTTKPSA